MKQPLSKKQVESIPLAPFKQQYAYTRFIDGTIVPEGSPYFSPPRLKYEFIPGQGYVPKLRR
jgi:hypothetical protein